MPAPSLPRRLAAGLLSVVVRLVPAASREWVNAMRRELDFIESDWSALLWAMGSMTAVFRHSGRSLLTGLADRFAFKEEKVNDNQRRMFGVAGGVGAGFVLAAGAFGLLLVLLHWISDPLRMPFLAQLTIVGVPEILFALIAVRLWRKRRPMAIGVLASAVLLGAHVVTHLATHGVPR